MIQISPHNYVLTRDGRLPLDKSPPSGPRLKATGQSEPGQKSWGQPKYEIPRDKKSQGWARHGTGQSRDFVSRSRLSRGFESRLRSKSRGFAGPGFRQDSRSVPICSGGSGDLCDRDRNRSVRNKRDIDEKQGTVSSRPLPSPGSEYTEHDSSIFFPQCHQDLPKYIFL